MFKKIAMVILATWMIAACFGPKKLDPTAFLVDTGPKESIPQICRAAYESAAVRVAVVNFTNNTTFDFAKSVTANVQGSSQRSAVGGAAVGVGPGVAGVVWGAKEQASFQQNAQVIERQINAKLAESIEDGVTDEIVNMGGATVFTRKEIEKVLSEQKFQLCYGAGVKIGDGAQFLFSHDSDGGEHGRDNDHNDRQQARYNGIAAFHRLVV